MVNVESAHCELYYEISIKGLYMGTKQKDKYGHEKDGDS